MHFIVILLILSVIYNLSAIMTTDDRITGEEARELSAQIENIEQEIRSLRAKLKRNTV